MMLENRKTLFRKAKTPALMCLLVLAGVAAFNYLTFIPAQVSAVTTGTTGQPDSPVVSVIVKPVLTMTVSTSSGDGGVAVTANSDEIVTGQFEAKVSSNHGYTLSLSAAEHSTPDLTNDTNEKIPAVASDAIVEAGRSAWGIRACVDGNVNYSCTEGDNVLGKNPFRGIAAFGGSKEFYRSTMGVEDEVTPFQVGIGVDTNLSSGTYSTNVVVTAMQI